MRTVLITGATSGFGLLLVKEFLNNGDHVIATGRNLNQRQDILSEERRLYTQRLIELDLDVTSSEQIEKICTAMPKTLDILINNAGYGLWGALENLDAKEIRLQIETNLMAPIFVTKALLPILRKSKAKVFNISSAFGFVGFPLGSIYCASKFGLEGLTESLAYELSSFGVQFCAVEPGGYRTGFLKNSQWSRKQYGEYTDAISNFENMQKKIGQRKRYQDPKEVAQGVLKLSLKEKIPLRIRFGRDSKFTWFLKYLLPTQIFFALTNRVYTKILFKQVT